VIIAHVVQRVSKHHQLTVYEYCFGLNFLAFHVDSRKNLFYLDNTWHTSFDNDQWILLPGVATLADVHEYIKSSIACRRDPAADHVEEFTTKWPLLSKTRYQLVPLPKMEPEPFLRLGDNKQWFGHPHPYRDLPDLVCHVAPPYVIINAGPKCAGLDLDLLARTYCQSETGESQEELRHRLELLHDIWGLIEGAKEAAKAWEEKEREAKGKRKRKRDKDDIDTSSMTTKRTTRSQSRSANGRREDQPHPSRPGSHASEDQYGGSTIRKRKRGNSSNGATLTEAAVLHLSKRRRLADSNTTVARWVKSTYC